MPKLNDTQTLLLAQAANRDSGALYPLPQTRNGAAARAATAIAALMKLGMAEERETTDNSAVSRRDGDLRYGAYVTAAGLAAINVTVEGEGGEPALPAAAPQKPATKTDTVLSLLRRGEGATLADLIAATGWLPHTTRAALTGLRKKGHVLVKSKRDDATCYRIEVVA
ncbi:hypothetical protein ASG29_16135 [Sphingomonas sp. Leaf412]|uniref:DUF3489 domain-containing protein n=1 Tax=Sphingomonas sp. Leaf412 TaxID=1736370 RepID=UPI0007014FCE|nr:DUF3489 domain-containing protein [Sphingomonas sp. Leaf412]KQT31030.1 hypothetical protein ASG29_16135 [Sphingomonas sp. Leaf412]